MTTTRKLHQPPAAEVYYPQEDADAMGETTPHRAAVKYLGDAVSAHLIQEAEVAVHEDLFLYYDEHDLSLFKAPDVLVARGVRRDPRRRSLRLWEVRAVLAAVFEILSERTWREDHGEKREIYEHLRVREYFLFDPEGTYQSTPLLGFRLEGDELKPIVPEPDGSLISRELAVRLRVEGMLLRVVSLATGEPYPTFLEAGERAQAARQQVEQAQQQAEQERQAREQAQQQAEQERQGREQERQAREQAQQQAEQERQAREQAERRAAELAAELARLRSERST